MRLMVHCLLFETFSLEVLSTTSNSTSSSGGDETDLSMWLASLNNRSRCRDNTDIYCCIYEKIFSIFVEHSIVIKITFLPGGAYLLTVDGTPTCCWLPPPKGWSTGFMATALTLGHLFLSLFILWNLLPAFKTGLSTLSPEAIIPIIALASPGRVFLAPDGSLTLVLLRSSEWPMMTAEVPEHLAILPWSPGLVSTLQTAVPSGTLLTGRTLPVAREAKQELRQNFWKGF